jgi:dTDP-4-dehydrorhamnose 3,5-epimerase
LEITPLDIEGAWLIQSPLRRDDRGYFREWFKPEKIENLTGVSFSAEQGNISQSSKGVLRGIHYSLAPGGQAKWVTCVNGKIKDVIVDIRESSKTFGKWLEVELSSDSGKSILIGKDLGHAFLSLEEKTIITYLVSSPFSPNNEVEINPLDPTIGIEWGIDASELLISRKDLSAPSLLERKNKGQLPN